MFEKHPVIALIISWGGVASTKLLVLLQLRIPPVFMDLLQAFVWMGAIAVSLITVYNFAEKRLNQLSNFIDKKITNFKSKDNDKQ